MSKLTFALLWLPLALFSQPGPSVKKQIDLAAAKIEPRLIDWRHHLHANPELSNREFETSKYVEKHLRGLGIEVRTGIAHTGVVGILRTGRPGPTIGLRADMDALPVEERNSLPFASKVKTVYNGQEVSVMHACGHDMHVSMLMAAAEILTAMKDQLNGTVVFIFQPAEEGAPEGEEGGAELMIKEGVMDNPKIDKIFGLHMRSSAEVGTINYRPGGMMAAVDQFFITVKGKGAHGSKPWQGIDPIAVGAQIINGLQYIVSRQMKLTEEACVITVGKFTGGLRSNIIPEKSEMWGTIRTLDTAMQTQIHAAIRRTAVNIAESMGATAEVRIVRGYPITYNDPALTEAILPTLREVAGKDKVVFTKADTGAEDFSFFARKVPGVFLWLGGMPKGQDPEKAPSHHTPDFFVDDSGMLLGVRTLCYLVVDNLK